MVTSTRSTHGSPGNTRGNALVEFALSFGLLLAVFSGVWQFGYTFYIYNGLVSAVRNGARYGALADYDGGSSNGASYKANVANMAVYGTANPASGASPIVPGLTTSKVSVVPTVDSAGVPSRVTVQITGFTIPDDLSGIFAAFTLNGKPSCSFEYTGRYTVP
ncbi:MAG TPA: TadE/TadG family type IV pilus assembly protein [Terriglobales bacterium]|nr:TadE/TadG family type IV pilus assembly protein [Terriglobales bacterium]